MNDDDDVLCLQMPPSPSRIDEERVDDVEEVDDVEKDGLEEVLSNMEPYVKDKSKIDELKQKLQDIGVSNLSNVTLLEHKDVEQFFTLINFRQFLKERKDSVKKRDCKFNISMS